MKNIRPFLLLFVSSLLFVVSLVFLWIWGIHLNVRQNPELIKNSPVYPVSVNNTRDSLTTVLTATANDLDHNFDFARHHVDSLKILLDWRLGEFYRLRGEIADLLKNKSRPEDLILAKQKIEELQRTVKNLLDKNLDVEYENKKLTAVLRQLSGNENKNFIPVVQKVSNDAPLKEEKNDAISNVIVSDLHLSALVISEEKELETNKAEETGKLTGSFTVRNSSFQINNAELMVVIVQPNGQVLKNSEWDSGSFLTEEGRKIYSYKFRFEYSRGEVKHLNFTLSTEKYQKGNYTMQIYHKGILIGRTQKSLS